MVAVVLKSILLVSWTGYVGWINSDLISWIY